MNRNLQNGNHRVTTTMIDLSILICTIKGREDQFNKLKSQLDKQIQDKRVEVLSLYDDKSMPVGEKRNKLVLLASGKYISFIDDDDTISDDYINKILSSINNNPDCVGIKGVITFSGRNPKIFIHSIKYNKYFEQNGVYYRPPNHLNPIKREIALKFKFPLKNCGEDTDWAMDICKSNVLRTEVFIDDPIYYYLYDHNKTETQK